MPTPAQNHETASAFNPAPDIADITIVGGGLVGATLALALAQANPNAGGPTITVIESRDINSQPPEEKTPDRTLALTDLARRIFTAMGIWQHLTAQNKNDLQPILQIHISERKQFGATHLHHTDLPNLPALGYVVSASLISQVLHQQIQQTPAITLLAPAEVHRIQPTPTHTRLHLRHSNAKTNANANTNTNTTHLQTRLLILADGGRSNLGAQLHLNTRTTRYPQNAILSIIHSDRPHNARAYERFTPEGPLALLPYSNNRLAVVWTTPDHATDARIALSDPAFIAHLQHTFGDRAGNFSRPTPRTCYPLYRRTTETPINPSARALAIGNAANSVHPVAAQGFNLALRDIAVLADLIQTAVQQNQDLAAPQLLQKYAAARTRETTRVSDFTDSLIQIFTNPRPPVRLARNLALTAVEFCPLIKRALLRRTIGLASSPTRLAAGIPFNET